MANKPFSTTNPTHPTRLPMPMGRVQPVKPGLPANIETTVIRPTQAVGQDAETAGSQGASAGPAPSNGVLGAYRSAIVAPPGYRVP